MSKVTEKLSEHHLINLFETKMLKSTKIYLQKIQQYDSEAERIIVGALVTCLVKKATTPMGMFTALCFYRELILQSEFQFLQSDGFPDSIHKEIFEACLFNYKQKNISLKGKNYFKQILGTELNKDIQALGCSYVKFALEIIIRMSQWYPNDYISKENSRYRNYYNQLITRKVISAESIFEPKYMSEKQKGRFMQNFLLWKENIDELEREIENQQLQQSQAKKKEQQRKKQHQNQNQKKNQDQDKGHTNTEKSAIKNGPKDSKAHTNNNIIPVVSKNEKIASLNSQQITTKTEDKNNKQKQVKEELQLETKMIKNDSKKIQQSPITKLSTRNNENSEEKTLLNQLNIALQSGKSLKQQEEQANLNNQIQRENYKLSSHKKNKIAKTQHYSPNKHPQIKTMTPNVQEFNSKKSSRKMESLHRRESEQIQRNYSVNKIETKQKTQLDGDNPGNAEAKQRYEIEKQKRQTGLKGKTLSEYRLEKNMEKYNLEKTINKKLLMRRPEIIISDPVFLHLQKLKLKPTIIPYIGRYFEPIDDQMHRLLRESLSIYDFPSKEASQPFYQDHYISARIIKNKGFYILSLLNKNLQRLNIYYSKILQHKLGDEFSQQISIERGNGNYNGDLIQWELLPNRYLDIKFQFSTTDANFKFLSLCLIIQENPLVLIMPITLLDQGQIVKNLDASQILSLDSLNGRVIKCEFQTNRRMRYQFNSLGNNMRQYNPLPVFFGRPKQKDRIIGQFTYRLKLSLNSYVSLGIYAQCLNGNQYQVSAIYNYQEQINQDYAKVIVYLTCLFLKQILNYPQT